MLLVRRSLLNAPAAATQQLRYVNSTKNYDVPRTDLEMLTIPDRSKTTQRERCWASQRRSEFKCPTDIEFEAPVSFFDKQAKCVDDPCIKAFPPRDRTLYKPSDMMNRKYQRTWRECVIEERKRKAVCKSSPILYERRTRSTSKLTARSPPVSNLSLGLGPCRRKGDSPCPRVKSPHCKEANLKGCFPVTPPSKCKKRRTKYPSYSECLKDPLPDLAPSECFCINTPPMCVVWNYYRMKKS
ncbi:uncharacterized protein boly [Drosophila kikkawai]|uniref:Uncharacterized protein boly n=1 Tax=Drosophila kikkawai TaxID=30033 RepID=A0A6P4HMY6_DROKI|nr:uncharacterized protein LOC108070850 [Drosophila kikkawai]